METPKIINLSYSSDNESSKLATKNDTLLMTKIMENMAKEAKTIQPLNLRQKLLKQIFVIFQMHIFL